ncbi:MAG TPA: helix-turn-helix transcriptional regulator [Clostridia bacterium]|nr:helix-turn-helix transcriptional regulator [Clostridia bacterium]
MIRMKLGAQSDNVVDFRNIRKRSLPYFVIWIVYYAWVIAFATWWTASPQNGDVFNEQFRSLMHAVNLISSAVFVFIIRKEWFVKLARVAALLVVAGVAAFFLVENHTLRLILAVASSVAIGCINICILMPFVFTLNNTEKLYAVVGSNLIIQLVSLLLAPRAQERVELAFSLAMLAVSVGATWFFRQKDLSDETEGGKLALPKLPKRIYLTIFFNCAFAILCKGAGKGILNISEHIAGIPLMTWNFLGGLIGCALFPAVYLYSKKAYLWHGNMTFAFVAMGLFCNAFAGYSAGFAIAFAVLLGIGNAMGMINMYYIIGVVGKKYDSMKYIRLSIALIGVCGGVSGVLLGNIISESNTFGISIVASVVSAAVMILLLISSPFLAQSHYESDWAKDSQRAEVDNEQLYLFSKYNLSKREIEVCKLLLQGFTMRQISGMLALAYPTVNTYCTSIYRKVGINSRAELMQVFRDYQTGPIAQS